MYVCKKHKKENKKWRKMYPDDLLIGEIVPFGAIREHLTPYWWIKNENNTGHSRWRSQNQREKLFEYTTSGQFENDFKRWEQMIESHLQKKLT